MKFIECDKDYCRAGKNFDAIHINRNTQSLAIGGNCWLEY